MKAMQQVAPLAGAWIETRNELRVRQFLQSPLSRGRGLKLDFSDIRFHIRVAPLAGAWIETERGKMSCRTPTWSPLSRGGGLKPLRRLRPIRPISSPLSRGRGLKPADNL